MHVVSVQLPVTPVGLALVPVPAGSYVIHYANKIHFDDAKADEAVSQVWSMGPATSTPAEKR